MLLGEQIHSTGSAGKPLVLLKMGRSATLPHSHENRNVGMNRVRPAKLQTTFPRLHFRHSARNPMLSNSIRKGAG